MLKKAGEGGWQRQKQRQGGAIEGQNAETQKETLPLTTTLDADADAVSNGEGEHRDETELSYVSNLCYRCVKCPISRSSRG